MAPDTAFMSFVMTLSFVLIGAAAAAAAIVALLLPEGRALQAGLTLILGAGVGVAILALGVFATSASAAHAVENVFLVASVCGFAAVLTGLRLVRRRGDAGSGVRSSTDGPVTRS